MLSRCFFASCLCAVVLGYNTKLRPRDDCGSGYTECSPKGASTSGAPTVGSSLSGLYVDLLDSINKVQKMKRNEEQPLDIEVRDSTGSVCCADGTSCLLLQDLELPFCYDKFTTNYFLPGGAYGQITSGNYTSSGGEANLLTGNYTLSDGTTGTIDKPNTATLTLPTQYTASGVGSAIPVSALGQWTTFTTTIPGTTIMPTTISAHVLAASTVSGSVEPATTEPAETLAATTIAPKISVVTTRAAAATTSHSSNVGTLEIKYSVMLGLILIVSLASMMVS